MQGAIERVERLATKAKNEGALRTAIVSMFDVENNAVRVLAAELRQRGHEVVELYFKDWISNHLDIPTDDDLEAFVKVLTDRRIDMVCLSIRASAYYESARLLTRTTHERTQATVLWGGMHPTICPEQSLDNADMILCGEGEIAFAKLTDALAQGQPFADLQNIGLWTEQGQKINPNAPLIKDLDELAFRDYTSHDDKYFIWRGKVAMGDPMRGDPVFQMMASRGCLFKCSFCYNSTFKDDVYKGQNWYRVRSVDSTLDEIVAAKEHWDFKRVRFDDEVFNPNKTWLKEFCEKYPKRVGLPFEVFIEPKLVKEEPLRMLREAGLTGVFMGIQAGERVTGDLYDRYVKNEALESIAKLLKKLDIHPHYQLIFDDPESDDIDRKALFDMIADFPQPFDLFLFSMTVFPASALNTKLINDGVITEFDLEGTNARTFYQHRVNLRYPRPVEETFWISLIIMLSKGWVPQRALRTVSKSKFLRKHPWPVIQAAHATNYIKMGGMAAKMIKDGEMTKTLVRRWLSFDRVITA